MEKLEPTMNSFIKLEDKDLNLELVPPSQNTLQMEREYESKPRTAERRNRINLEEEVASLLTCPENPLIKYGHSSFTSEITSFNEHFVKENLATIAFTPENILYTLKKRVEYTFDDYPLLTEENKEAQKLLNPILEQFCAKFDLKMLDVPST